jgi:hypothetical protein
VKNSIKADMKVSSKLVLLVFIALFIIPISHQLVFASSGYQDFRILSASESALIVEFTPKLWKSGEVTVAGSVFTEISFENSVATGNAGDPQLPARLATIGLPTAASPHVDILDAQFVTEKDVLLLPNPTMEKLDLDYQTSFNQNPSTYNRSGFIPEKVVDAERPIRFRSQYITRLVIHPLQYQPLERIVKRYTKMTIQIRFNESVPTTQASPLVAADEHLYENLLLNYQQERKWRLPRPARLAKPADYVLHGENWFKVIIRGDGISNKEGIYKLDVETMSAAGVPTASVDPSTLQLFSGGGRELPGEEIDLDFFDLVEMPIEIIGVQDGKLDLGDYILFYGRSLEGYDFDKTTKKFAHYINHYSYENVYWLTFGKATRRKMQENSSLPATGVQPEPGYRDFTFIEEEKRNPLASGIHWFGFELSSERDSYSYNFDIAGAIPEDSASFRFRIATESSGSHAFEAYVNGNFIGAFSQSGIGSGFSFGGGEFVAAGVLMEGTNTVTLKYLASSDISYSLVDWLEIEFDRQFIAKGDQIVLHSPLRDGVAYYQLKNFGRNDISVYDVTNPGAIKKMMAASVQSGTFSFVDATNATERKRYVAVTPAAYKKVTSVKKAQIENLRNQRNADYIIIAYDDFYQQALQLESLRENWNLDDRLETEVVKMSSVVDEFGWGIPDPAAIKYFLAYAQDNWNAPRYVLLFGDGHYDYKDILKHGLPNYIPPYESEDGTDTSTRTTDDWFTYTRGTANRIQMAIGRLPVQTVDEAQSAVDKIVSYETKPYFGEWRKTYTIVADDELVTNGAPSRLDEIHTQQAEILAENHVPVSLIAKKIYLINYPAIVTASVAGVTKPAATDQLLDQINRGSLVINYIGHGNDELWSHERVLLETRDLQRIQNEDRLALWVAATCEFAYWDQPQKQSFAEAILNARRRGAVALVSSARLAYSSENFDFNLKMVDVLFNHYSRTGTTERIGDAVMLAKIGTGSRVNNEKYGVFGDPTMRLRAPRYRAVIDQIAPDSIQALRKMHLTGQVEKDGQLWQNFDGKVLVRVMDSRQQKSYQTALGGTITYMAAGNSIFKGITSALGGEFSLEFIVPKDISYGGSQGRISLYSWNDDSDGTGNLENLAVGGTAVTLVDHVGPEIQMDFGRADFAYGDFTGPNPLMNVEIIDSLSGVNIAGDIGHQIMMTLDDDVANAKDLTDFFEYDEGSYVKGSIKYSLYDVAEGPHDIAVKAWDNSNNSSILKTNFVVVADSVFKVRNVLNYPNPMRESSLFTFEISQNARVTLKIYSVAGRLLREFAPFIAEIGFNIFPETWDGTDQDGDKLANGVYLYKLTATSLSGSDKGKAEKIGKLIIAR